jgi:predicted O-linked N-acetylglucosamine transferase (SPINDLY family)
LGNGYLTFGSFQKTTKLNDNVLAAWGRIMQKLPRARLRLQNQALKSSTVRQLLLERLARSGIAPERVSLAESVPRPEYLAAHARIDIILDTFPFTGGTTTCEALWMGVPTLTIAGDNMLARQGASLLACAGLAEWIAGDAEEYVAKAVAHSADLEKLAALRAGLRHQVLASPLFDGPRFARHFQEALWGMWQRFTAGP